MANGKNKQKHKKLANPKLTEHTLIHSSFSFQIKDVLKFK